MSGGGRTPNEKPRAAAPENPAAPAGSVYPVDKAGYATTGPAHTRPVVAAAPPTRSAITVDDGGDLQVTIGQCMPVEPAVGGVEPPGPAAGDAIEAGGPRVLEAGQRKLQLAHHPLPIEDDDVLAQHVTHEGPITIFGGGQIPFPKPPRELARPYFHVTTWAEHDRGGHFPAITEPRLLADTLRDAFRPLRHKRATVALLADCSRRANG